jgi:hypothetical protein
LEELGLEAEMNARTASSLATGIGMADFDYDRSNETGGFSEREFRGAKMKLRKAGFIALELFASIGAAYIAAKAALALGFGTDWSAAISAFVLTATVLTIGRHLGLFSNRS